MPSKQIKKTDNLRRVAVKAPRYASAPGEQWSSSGEEWKKPALDVTVTHSAKTLSRGQTGKFFPGISEFC